MPAPHPNEYLWLEIDLMMQHVEMALQVLAVYTQWFCFTAAAFAAVGITAIFLLALHEHHASETSQRLLKKAIRPRCSGLPEVTRCSNRTTAPA